MIHFPIGNQFAAEIIDNYIIKILFCYSKRKHVVTFTVHQLINLYDGNMFYSYRISTKLFHLYTMPSLYSYTYTSQEVAVFDKFL